MEIKYFSTLFCCHSNLFNFNLNYVRFWKKKNNEKKNVKTFSKAEGSFSFSFFFVLIFCFTFLFFKPFHFLLILLPFCYFLFILKCWVGSSLLHNWSFHSLILSSVKRMWHSFLFLANSSFACYKNPHAHKIFVENDWISFLGDYIEIFMRTRIICWENYEKCFLCV